MLKKRLNPIRRKYLLQRTLVHLFEQRRQIISLRRDRHLQTIKQPLLVNYQFTQTVNKNVAPLIAPHKVIRESNTINHRSISIHNRVHKTVNAVTRSENIVINNNQHSNVNVIKKNYLSTRVNHQHLTRANTNKNTTAGFGLRQQNYNLKKSLHKPEVKVAPRTIENKSVSRPILNFNFENKSLTVKNKNLKVSSVNNNFKHVTAHSEHLSSQDLVQNFEQKITQVTNRVYNEIKQFKEQDVIQIIQQNVSANLPVFEKHILKSISRNDRIEYMRKS